MPGCPIADCHRKGVPLIPGGYCSTHRNIERIYGDVLFPTEESPRELARKAASVGRYPTAEIQAENRKVYEDTHATRNVKTLGYPDPDTKVDPQQDDNDPTASARLGTPNPPQIVSRRPSWADKVPGKQYCTVGTAARMLGEPVVQTQERVENWELPLVVHGTERLIPISTVLQLRELPTTTLEEQMEGIDPKVAAEIRQQVAEIAGRDYPRVWVGEVGMTVDELLQEMNHEGSEWMSIEPGQRTELEDTGAGITMPGLSVDWIEGDVALAMIPDHFAEGELGNLQDEVAVIRAAKAGAVMVRTAFTVAYAVGDELDALSTDDRLSLLAAWFKPNGEPAAMFFTGSTYRMIFLDKLTHDDVDDELLEQLGFYASGETWEPYLVDDTSRARALVEARLRN